MDEKEVQKAYIMVLNALEDEDFKKWLETNKESLGFEYDQWSTHLMDNNEEPIGYYIWALGKYFWRNEKITVLTLKDGKDVEKLHDALAKVFGEDEPWKN
jgi:hypothetical protein